MGRNNLKTGLAARMREWMKAQTRPFTKRDIYLGLGIERPADRDTLRNAVPDFARRGEIILQPPDKRNRGQDVNRYLYNSDWKGAQKGSIKPRILKAMYVCGTFAVTDIQRLVGTGSTDMGTDLKSVPISSRAWIDRIVRGLRRAGHISIVGRRPCAHGAGAEAIYHVADRDKFRLEVMR
jgi:hypothetical protein